MKGEAHNQLHTFLLPIGPMLASLGKSEGDNAKKTLAGLGERLEVYGKYFE